MASIIMLDVTLAAALLVLLVGSVWVQVSHQKPRRVQLKR